MPQVLNNFGNFKCRPEDTSSYEKAVLKNSIFCFHLLNLYSIFFRTICFLYILFKSFTKSVFTSKLSVTSMMGAVYQWNKEVWECNTVLYVRLSYSVHYIVLQMTLKLLAGMLCN